MSTTVCGNRFSCCNRIENQRAAVLVLIDTQQDMRLHDVYCDNGETGTNFDRPAFARLMRDLRTGTINCVVVKDLSRFGRSYIEVGNFLEKVLSFLGVRFISVNDGYDSQNSRCIGGLDTVFKNLLNDLYSRDCSVKVKNGKRTTALQGKYQNPWAPFGYVKSAQERGKLEADHEAAEIVRRIFVLFLEGRGTVEVARILNRDGVPTKSAYRAAQGDQMRWQYAGGQNGWNAAAVRGILTDRRYIGSVVYGRQQAKGVAAHRNVKASDEALVEVEHCHEPLVSREEFDRAQGMQGKGKHHGKSDRPLTGKIKCGVCGHAMPLRRGKEPYFTCGSKWYDADCACGDVRVGQAELYEVLTATLRQQIDLQVEQEALRQVAAEKRRQQQAVLEQRRAGLERQLAQNKEKMQKQFERFVSGEVNQGNFLASQRQCKVHIAQFKTEMRELWMQIEKLAEKEQNTGPASLTADKDAVIMNNNGIKVSMKMLDVFIREVRLHPHTTIEVSWNFEEI